MGGAIAIRYMSDEKIGDLLWSHSTNTMIIGYMNSTEKTAVVSIIVTMHPPDKINLKSPKKINLVCYFLIKFNLILEPYVNITRSSCW